jgi:hypothetical protein
MACKKSCGGACKTETQPVAAPTEAFVELDVGSVVAVLTAIASTGIKNLSFKDVGLENLASKLSAIAAENEYLKKLVSLLSPVSAENTSTEIHVRFGPGNAYCLTLPIAADNKETLAQQLVEIAKILRAPTDDKQQLSLFS